MSGQQNGCRNAICNHSTSSCTGNRERISHKTRRPSKLKCALERELRASPAGNWAKPHREAQERIARLAGLLEQVQKAVLIVFEDTKAIQLVLQLDGP